MFSLITREDSAKVMSAISAIVDLANLLTPTLAGWLATISPSLPYLAGLSVIGLTLPLYALTAGAVDRVGHRVSDGRALSR